MTYLTYRVSFRTHTGKQKCLPVLAADAIKARESLTALGYDVCKVTYCSPNL